MNIPHFLCPFHRLMVVWLLLPVVYCSCLLNPACVWLRVRCWDGKVTWPGLGPQGCHSAVKGKGKCESRSVVSDSLRPRGLYSPWKSPGQNTGVGSLSLLQGISPTQGSNPVLSNCRRILYQLSHKGSQIILEWVTYPFSSRSSPPRN